MACGQRVWPGKGQGSAGHPVVPANRGGAGLQLGDAGEVGRGPGCCLRVVAGTGRTSVLWPGLGEGWGTHGPPRHLGRLEAARLVLEQPEGTCPGPTDLMALLWVASGGWETDLGHL